MMIIKMGVVVMVTMLIIVIKVDNQEISTTN